MPSPVRLALAAGDPAGVGPELIAALAVEPLRNPVTVVGDGALLARVAEARGVGRWPAGLAIEPVGELSPALSRGEVSAEAGAAGLAYLERATARVESGAADALVTAPLNKLALRAAGATVSGHTTWLARRTGCQPTMMFDAPGLRLALATIHIPLADVPGALSPALIERCLRRLEAVLRLGYGISRPRLGLLGLNPHAGEGGLLGREEATLVDPVLERLRGEGLVIDGPLPPDTAFLPARRAAIDGYLALYHDQGLIALKTLAFADAVQLTCGLPFLRTSVAHGTAFDQVGGEPCARSLRRALALAAELAPRWPAVAAALARIA